MKTKSLSNFMDSKKGQVALEAAIMGGIRLSPGETQHLFSGKLTRAVNKQTIANLIECNGMKTARRIFELSESPRCLTQDGPICLSDIPFCMPGDSD